MELFIGQNSFKGSFANYAGKHSMIELLAEPQRLPKLAKLREYRAQAPEGFVFSVVLSPTSMEDSDAGRAALDFGVKVREALDARWLVLRSTSADRPGLGTQRRLEATFVALRQAAPAACLAWEARGLWDARSIQRAAQQLSVQPVVDTREAFVADIIYARMMRLGVGARTGSRALERLVETLVQSQQAYLIVDGGSASPVRSEITELLAELAAELDEDELDEDELDEDAEEVDGDEDSVGDELDDPFDGSDSDDESEPVGPEEGDDDRGHG